MKMFDPERWEKAISKGLEKGIRKWDLHEMCDPEWLKQLAIQIWNETYRPVPPHMAEIPKDEPGKFRTVFANEGIDRVIFSVINDLLIDELRKFIHPSCVSYLPGIGTVKIVRWISDLLNEGTEGFKEDLSKYFDSVPLWAVDELLDKLPKSKVVDAIRRYYHSDECFDLDGNLVKRYQSLKQGCAVASFLADALLYEMDKKLTEMAKSVGGLYYRYSDDILYLGRNHKQAMEVMKAELARFELVLNPKKFEPVNANRWFKFLGWHIKGTERTLSAKRVKNYKDALYKAAMAPRSNGKQAVRRVTGYLYGGEHSWATSVLPGITVEKDIKALDEYAKDVIRCCSVGRYKRTDVGGLGVNFSLEAGTIQRGKGNAVRTARERTEEKIPGYLSLFAARNALLTSREAYETLIRGL